MSGETNRLNKQTKFNDSEQNDIQAPKVRKLRKKISQEGNII